MPRKDYTGQRFGKLTAVKFLRVNQIWLFRCDCGANVEKSIWNAKHATITMACDECCMVECAHCKGLFLPGKSTQTICRSNPECKKLYGKKYEAQRPKRKEPGKRNRPEGFYEKRKAYFKAWNTKNYLKRRAYSKKAKDKINKAKAEQELADLAKKLKEKNDGN